MPNRRQFVAGIAALSALPVLETTAQVATPFASPVATPIAAAPTTDTVLPAWQEAMEQLRALGRTAADAVFQSDADSIATVSTDAVAAAIADPAVLTDAVNMFTTSQIRFYFADVDAWFYARYTPGQLAGYFYQGGAYGMQALPDEEQTKSWPTGTWRGVIAVGTQMLQFDLAFTGDANDLAVSLTIASQGITDVPMTQVQAPTDLVIGDRVDERALPIGGEIVPTNSYSAEYAWHDHTLVLASGWDTSMRLSGLMLMPQPPLPPLPENTPIVCRLPFDGAWLAYWAGDTVFANYHAAVPMQRTAMDLMIWNEGATCHGDGTRPEDYFCFGQPLLAPVSGTVVEAVDGYDDIVPQSVPNQADHPAGNHIMIETEGGFVLLAHCQRGSVGVAVGDTVSPGDHLALVGNSGNTSEPHVHMHAQSTADYADPTAIAIPIVFEQLMVNGVVPDLPVALHHSTIIEHIG